MSAYLFTYVCGELVKPSQSVCLQLLLDGRDFLLSFSIFSSLP